ncbi:piggyBac transposable element-derived protein 2-like [Ornithodoros turicata]|uniref:piggyBac transposable element-derived protein 2-like n=1 Tax=Ornithodoros turicata TaxID=34597 RepID=UPI00313A27B1
MVTECNPRPPSKEAENCSTPREFLELFLNKDIMRIFREQTILYAAQKNTDLSVTDDEILVLLGGLLLSGYAKYPNKMMFWSRQSDTPTILADIMRCNRFESILRCFHLNDNSKLDTTDRLYKVRPFLEVLEAQFKRHGAIDEDLCIDETSGYMLSFEIYVGKIEDPAKKFGLGGDTVLSLLTGAEIPPNPGYKIFFDNYFTSVKLLEHFSEMGYCATGTARENRVDGCPLKPKSEMKKLERGSYDYRTRKNVLLVRWNDNSVVTVATNYDGIDVGATKRWSREQRKHATVPQPKVVAHYNKGMGGVDNMDQQVATYRTRMRQRKWL